MNMRTWSKILSCIVFLGSSTQSFATVTTIDVGTLTSSNSTYSDSGSLSNYADIIEYAFTSSSALSDISIISDGTSYGIANPGLSGLYLTLWKSSGIGEYSIVSTNTDSTGSSISTAGDSGDTVYNYILTLTANSMSGTTLSNAIHSYENTQSNQDLTMISSILGRSTNYNISISGTVAAVPEPETYALMGIGLLGLITAHRRKKQQGYKSTSLNAA